MIRILIQRMSREIQIEFALDLQKPPKGHTRFIIWKLDARSLDINSHHYLFQKWQFERVHAIAVDKKTPDDITFTNASGEDIGDDGKLMMGV